MRLVIAPDKLRGTYTAAEAAAALAAGWREQRPRDSIGQVPLADGGEGTAAALLAAAGGRWQEASVHDAAGRQRTARYALLDDGSAALDVADACGALAVADLPPDPLGASSLGAGELLAAALASGAHTVVVGVGGTASTDGGVGLREALPEIPAGVRLLAALDVENPLLGEHGAAAAYGPQKGATPEQVELLERRLRSLALASAGRPGAGAGGGIGGMLMELGASAVSGADLVIERSGLAARLSGASLCITAEGRIDATTLRGKVVARVAELSSRLGVGCVAVGGQVEPEAAAELAARFACATHCQGDLAAAGRELARLRPPPGQRQPVV
ncbi:MAG TPA: glycerate kinase [Gaiellales bacterium]|nr:glycerate kinase [Gaiellales bacterium]